MNNKRYRSEEDEDKENRFEKRLKRIEELLMKKKKKHRKHKRRNRHESTSSESSRYSKDLQSEGPQTGAETTPQMTLQNSQIASQGSTQCQKNLPVTVTQREILHTPAQGHQKAYETPAQVEQGVSHASVQGQTSQHTVVQNPLLLASLATDCLPVIPSTERTDQQAEGQNSVLIVQQDSDDVPLDPKILEVMGVRFLEERCLAQAIPKELLVRWEEILNAGLPSEARVALVKKYPPPKNCVIIDPPKMNPEVRASLPEAIAKRDERILAKQTKLTACLAVVGKTFLTVLDKYKGQDNLEIFEQLSDIGKLLADLQHDESAIRKSLILANLNASFKDVLNAATPAEFLFGNQLDEKLKTAKALEISRKELKSVQKFPSAKGAKNSKLPPRQPQYNQQHYQSTSGGNKQRDTKNQGSSAKQGNHQKSVGNWKNNRKRENNSYQKRR